MTFTLGYSTLNVSALCVFMSIKSQQNVYSQRLLLLGEFEARKYIISINYTY
jgi:hypothetical protein